MSYIKHFIGFFISKSSCYLLLLVICNNKILAQELQNFDNNIEKNCFSIGISGGKGVSNTYFSGNNLQKMIPIIGMRFGLVFQHKTTKHLGVQLEINYVQKGLGISNGGAVDYSSIPNPTDTGKNTLVASDKYVVDYERKISYIEIPILTHFEMGKNKFRVIINVGPQIGFAIGYSENYKSEDENYLKTYEKLRYAEVKHNQVLLGFTIGTGFSYAFPFGTIQLEGRYFNSVTNVMYPGKYSNFYNQYLHGQVTYLYRLKIKKSEVEKDETD
jgi:hypothetical protein